jgi:hypothetical protein
MELNTGVFIANKIERCAACEGQILKDSYFLKWTGGGVACSVCGGFDELEYLPAGNNLLTKRVHDISNRFFVVLRYVMGFGRFQRVGILVDQGTIAVAINSIETNTKVQDFIIPAQNQPSAHHYPRKLLMKKEIKKKYPSIPDHELSEALFFESETDFGPILTSEDLPGIIHQYYIQDVVMTQAREISEYHHSQTGIPHRMFRGTSDKSMEQILREWARPLEQSDTDKEINKK